MWHWGAWCAETLSHVTAVAWPLSLTRGRWLSPRNGAHWRPRRIRAPLPKSIRISGPLTRCVILAVSFLLHWGRSLGQCPFSPPPVGPSVFHRDRRAEAEAAKREAEALGTPVPENKGRPRSKRRARSRRRNVAFRQENSEPADTVGQGAIETRGRPKSRAQGRCLGLPISGQKILDWSRRYGKRERKNVKKGILAVTRVAQEGHDGPT